MRVKIERVKTGVDGLDKLIEGGFPKGHCILLSGAPGTGKTIFGVQYIYEGAKNGEKGLYITFTEDIDDISLQASVFGLDLQKLIKNGSLKLLHIDIEKFDIKDIISEVKKGKYQRLVIDSLSAIISHPVALEDVDVSYVLRDRLDRLLPSPLHMEVATRLLVNKIVSEIKGLDCTSIIISELVEGVGGLSRDTVSEFLVDGVITLQYVMVGIESSRNLMIRKMRATAHSENIHPIEFKKGVGMSVLMP
ncbi:MAG TPA: hypothetical protein ENF58_03870 [Candidatus Altiarchaeales archaeon]|mgnify:FL=1|nr:hypothetical protein [Candidatus Altiarchaeales archaeon]